MSDKNTVLPPEFQAGGVLGDKDDKSGEVKDSPEFQRILKLPRRVWDRSIMENNLCGRISAAFKLPTGQQELRPIQAAALADAHDLRGLLGPIRVGEGKTLVSFLAPVVIQGIYRPTLLLPATLIEKTWLEFQEYKKHWICHPAFATRAQFDQAVISYEKMGRDSGKDAIMARMPDIVIADECHRLRNRQAACTKRVERFFRAFPHSIFVGMSGTITKRSIRDYWHLLEWALKAKNMPLPATEREMEIWAEALDERRVDVLSRRDPGVLMQFCTDEERQKVKPKRTAPLGRTDQMPAFFGNLEDKLVAVRTGYQRRLRETPGIICSPDQNLDCSLQIRRQAFDPGPEVMEHLEELRENWTTPNGDLLALPVDVWRHARELSCGFFYRWDPAPPSDWLQARKRWNWFVRQILTAPELIRRRGVSPFGQSDGMLYEAYKHLHLDSPFQVANAVVQERITHAEICFAYSEWMRVKDSYKINVVADWVSESTLDFCVDWVKHNTDSKHGAILWTEYRAFGEALAKRLGTGFCANGGLDAKGNLIDSYKGRTVVASVAANKEGRNLQAWFKNFVITAPPTGSLWEQMIGRTHRPGQVADTVYVDWLCACAEQDDGFSQLMADARYIQYTTGQSQKLLFADHVTAPMYVKTAPTPEGFAMEDDLTP